MNKMSNNCLIDARLASKFQIIENSIWKDYVLDFPSNKIFPIKYSFEANLLLATNLDHLIDPIGTPAPTVIISTSNPVSNGTYHPMKLILDFGKNTGGLCFINILNNNNTLIHVTYSESLETIGPGGDMPRETVLTPTSIGLIQLTSITSVANTYGQRYITLYFTPETSSRQGIVVIDSIYTEIKHFQPSIDDYQGHFLSNDDLLNKVWYSGVYTNSMCLTPKNVTTGPFVMVDGAKRDELCWLGDTIVEALSNYCVFGDKSYEFFRTTLSQWDSKQSVNGSLPTNIIPSNGNPFFPNTLISEYTADYVIQMADYYQISGDSEFVLSRIEIIRKILDVYYINNLNGDGLFLTKPNTDTITWNVDFGPGLTNTLNSLTNASFYQALRSGALLEREIGDPLRASSYDFEADKLRKSIINAFWDPDSGALFGNDQDPGAHYQDGNARSILYGILDKSKAKSSLKFLKRNLWTDNGTLTTDNQEPNNGSAFMQCNISPYMTGYEELARFSQDDTCNALKLIRNTQGKMVERDPHSTLFERLWKDGGIGTYLAAQAQWNIYQGISSPINSLSTRNPKDYYPDLFNGARGFISLAHGWSATSTYALSAYVLGIQSSMPGFSKWIIRPQVGDLKWAQGQFPTPHGVIISRFETNKCHCNFKMTISAPLNTSGTVYIPLFGQKRKIASNGNYIDYNIKDDYAVIQNVIGGPHTYAWGDFKEETREPSKVKNNNLNRDSANNNLNRDSANNNLNRDSANNNLNRDIANNNLNRNITNNNLNRDIANNNLNRNITNNNLNRNITNNNLSIFTISDNLDEDIISNIESNDNLNNHFLHKHVLNGNLI
jgi:hypothetical protein